MAKFTGKQNKLKKNNKKLVSEKKKKFSASENGSAAADDVAEKLDEEVKILQLSNNAAKAIKSMNETKERSKKKKNIKKKKFSASENRSSAADDVAEIDEEVKILQLSNNAAKAIKCMNETKERSKKKKSIKKKNIRTVEEKKEEVMKADDTIHESDETLPQPSNADNSEDTDEKMPSGKRKIKGKAEHRSEPSLTVSEFNLTEVGKEKIKLDELIKTTQKSGQLPVKKQLRNVKKLKSLSIPLSKPQQQKIKRVVAYDKVCNEASKWDTIVKSNRDAEQIIYPLKRPEFHLDNFETVSERFISKHPIEDDIAKILNTSENVLDQKRMLTVAEEKALQAMSAEEAKARHNELMRHRALLSYQEAKARRQNKIKSKRYHRIQKREKLKKLMKEFDELQKTDEVAALEKFLEADKLRILERMTLKHRNTGKWAKQQKIRAKYNPDSRSNLKEDLQIGKQLREKITAQVTLQQRLRDEEIDPEDKFFEDPSEEFLIEDVPFENNSTAETTMSKIENFVKSQTESKSLENTANEEKLSKSTEDSSKPPFLVSSVEEEMAFSSEVTPLNSVVPDDITFGDEDLDNLKDGIVTIDQAFADEEYIAEFQEEKKAADRANKVEGIDLFLPGWGNWGGPGIKASKRKRKRFFIKPLEPQVKKNTLGNVIINEEKDKKASEHQVSSLPFPFSNVHQFESYIRQPIGHTWNPPSSFQNLVAPKVITKMGKIIDPIDADDVVLEKKKQDKPLKRMKKKAPQELNAF